MGVHVETVVFRDLKVLCPDVYGDDRGFFLESYRADTYAAVGIKAVFVQDNHSRSVQGVLRGMHFQWDPPQGKLVRVTCGRAHIAVIDIRKGSPTLGQWFAQEVSDSNRKQLWVPPGFAHGFCALSEATEIQYKCTSFYNPRCESGIRWDDMDVGIKWPIKRPLLSEKDAKAQALSEWLRRPEADSFQYGAVV